jgi:hypothetical protein
VTRQAANQSGSLAQLGYVGSEPTGPVTLETPENVVENPLDGAY